jgi:hypothetical protein
MSHLQGAMIRSIQGFATELTRAPLYDGGHADAWELVERGQWPDLNRRDAEHRKTVARRVGRLSA